MSGLIDRLGGLAAGVLLVGFGVNLAGGDAAALFQPAFKAVTDLTGQVSVAAPELAEDTKQTATAFGDALRGTADAASNSLGSDPTTASTLPTPVQP